ncbi:MAG: cytochrome C oxidase subunit IV family protein [Myxococcota bacterium]
MGDHGHVHQEHTSTSLFHVSSLGMNIAIFSSLMVLTALTVWAAFQDFGPLDTPIAIVIAIVKASLVIMFFMHVKYSSKIVMLSAGSGFMFLIFLFAFTLSDYGTREKVDGWPESVEDTVPAGPMGTPYKEAGTADAVKVNPEGS